MRQALFFDMFFEKDPHLNTVEYMNRFLEIKTSMVFISPFANSNILLFFTFFLI